MPWKALGRGYSAILALHYPATASIISNTHYLQHALSPTQWNTLSTASNVDKGKTVP